MDLSVLNQPLEMAENPGLETTDPRLDEIATLGQDGDYPGAAAAAQSVLEAGVYDVRVLGFFFYGVFLEQGIAGLLPILQTLSGILRDNWQAFGPKTHKEKQTQTALRWFFNQLQKKLQYEENTKGGQWEEWLGAVTVEDVQEIIDAIDEIRRVLGPALQDASGPILDALGKISQWLRSFQQMVHSAPSEAEPEAESEAEPEPEPEYEPDREEELEEAEVEESVHERTRRAAPTRSIQPAPEERSETSIEGSYHLQMLIRKMEAFAQLIEEQKFFHAALVADDINETINNFDPKLFFPKLFSRYLSLLMLNIGEIIDYEDHKESPEWNAMKEYYRVDLDGFMQLQ